MVSEIKNILKKYPLTIVLFMFFSFLSFSLVLNAQRLSEGINERWLGGKEVQYFYALVTQTEETSAKKVESLVYKLVGLSGIERIQKREQNAVQKKIEKFTSDLNIALPKMLLNESLNALQVFVEPSLDASRVGLIKEYIIKFLGADDVTISRVYKKSPKFKKTPFVIGFKKYGEFFFVLLALIFWCIGLVIFRRNLGTRAYLIESFQRRNRVLLKLFLPFALLTSLTVTSLWSLQNTLSLKAFFLCIVFLLLGVYSTSRKAVWK